MKRKLFVARAAGMLMLAFCVGAPGQATAQQSAAPTTAPAPGQAASQATGQSGAQSSGQAAGQAAPQDGSKTPAQVSSAQQGSAADGAVQQDASGQAGQTMSLGDLARMVRAQRKSSVKAVKVVDNDDIPSAGGDAGQKAPDVAIATGPGQSSSLSQMKGKVVLMDFWATWCGPCRESLPDLKRLVATYGSDRLEVVSVSEDEDARAWTDFTARNQMNWTQQRDEGHRMMQQFGADALPTYVLIGDNGVILQKYVGEDTDYPLVERIGPDIRRALGASR
jgi:thiol-disulfide isomerase/thioredoxin